MKLVLATRNRGKAAEIREILEGLSIEILILGDIVPDGLPPETGKSFAENALIKARFAAKRTGLPAIADDSGLEVEAIGGRPGVFSARYAGAGSTDEENYRKLLFELEGVPPEGRGARFRCALAYVAPEGEEEVFEGALEGAIADCPRGEGGFGYDPVFIVGGDGRTAAELSPREKNRISHRAKALESFGEWLRKKHKNKILKRT